VFFFRGSWAWPTGKTGDGLRGEASRRRHDATRERHDAEGARISKASIINQSKMSGLSRAWCFTINNYTDEDQCDVYGLEMSKDVKYGIAGLEVGEQGTPHIQGYVYFKNPKSRKQLSEMLPRASLRAANGTADQNEAYCSKDGEFWEFGTKPMDQEEKGKRGKLSIEQRWDLCVDGAFSKLAPENLKAYEYVHRKFGLAAKIKTRGTLDNYWIHGPSGCGKSTYAREVLKAKYFKMANKWWDDYDGTSTVLIEDYSPKMTRDLEDLLKLWADHYPFKGEYKGGSMDMRPDRLIITSQYSIDDCFDSQESKDAIKRRFKQLVYNDITKDFDIIEQIQREL